MTQNSIVVGGDKPPIATRMAKLAIKGLAAGFARFLGSNAERPQHFDVEPAREVGRAEFRTAKLEPGNAVFWRAGEIETMPASRVVIVPLEAAKNVSVGRVWLYLYPEKQIIRRVFRVEDPQVRAILRMRKSSYYMTDVKWDPADGDHAIERIRQQAADDVVRLVTSASNERDTKDSRGSVSRTRKVTPAISIAPPAPAEKEVVKAAVAEALPPKAPEPEPQATVAPRVSATPVPAPVPTHPVAGEAREGVIVEMGKTPRQGNGGTYEAFCVKLEVNGVHIPYYGVELEREVFERQAKPGDRVRITLMDRMAIGQGRTKNLFKVEMLRKGAKGVQ